MKYFVGQRVRVGGSKGCIMTISEINGSNITLIDDNSTFYYQKGDCVLLPVKEFEQLCLFDL